jgi:hypothetical protein
MVGQITHKEGGNYWNSRFKELHSRLTNDIAKENFRNMTFAEKKKIITYMEKGPGAVKFKGHVIQSGKRK